MRYIHISAWIGLAVSGLVAFLVMPEFVQMLVEDSYSSSADIWRYFILAGYIGFALQAGGILFIAQRQTAGVVLAGIGSIPLLPLSIICFVGCSISRNNWRYESYEKVMEGDPAARNGFVYQDTSGMAAGMLIMGVVAVFLGAGAGGMIAAAGILHLVMNVKTKGRDVFALSGDSLYFMPDAWSGTMKLPYSRIISVEIAKKTWLKLMCACRTGAMIN